MQQWQFQLAKNFALVCIKISDDLRLKTNCEGRQTPAARNCKRDFLLVFFKWYVILQWENQDYVHCKQNQAVVK